MLAVIVYYVFCGLAICAVAGVHKWTTPYAVLVMVALWPAILCHAMLMCWKEALEEWRGRGKDGVMSKIEWTQKTWNPVAGCSDKSPGCTNCYAKKMAGRLEAMGVKKYEGLTVLQGSHRVWTGKIAFDEQALLAPLRRKKPTRYFVNSMSDLFHENVTDEQIDRIFAVMALCPQHTFQVLTKRPERMLAYLRQVSDERDMQRWVNAAVEFDLPSPMFDAAVAEWEWPLPNVWLGVSVENQATADERIPPLLQAPAAVRFISAEPLLGPVDVEAFLGDGESAIGGMEFIELDWVIVGGESGPGARPFNIEWARSIVQQCAAAGVACFVKQMGAKPFMAEDCAIGFTLRDRKGGDMAEWPEDLRVRQMPEVRG